MDKLHSVKAMSPGTWVTRPLRSAQLPGTEGCRGFSGRRGGRGRRAAGRCGRHRGTASGPALGGSLCCGSAGATPKWHGRTGSFSWSFSTSLFQGLAGRIPMIKCGYFLKMFFWYSNVVPRLSDPLRWPGIYHDISHWSMELEGKLDLR